MDSNIETGELWVMGAATGLVILPPVLRYGGLKRPKLKQKINKEIIK